MTTQGPNTPSTAANDGIGSPSWTNPGNARVEDASLATCVMVAQFGDILDFSGLGWSGLSGVTITNILVECKMKVSTGTVTFQLQSADFGIVALGLTCSGTSLAWQTLYNGAANSTTRANIIANSEMYKMQCTTSYTGTWSVDAFRVTITYTTPPSATGASSVPKLTSAAVAKQTQKSTSATSSIPKLTSAAVVHTAAFSAPAASSLPKLTSAAVAKQTQKATSAASSMPKLTSSGVAKEIQKAVGASTLPKLTSLGAVRETRYIAAAASTLPRLVASGIVQKDAGFYEPGIRIDVHTSAGVKTGRGPILTVLDFEQGGGLDIIGNAKLTLAANDLNAQIVVPDMELRVYRGGEGFIGDYDVIETMTRVDNTGQAILECLLLSVENRIGRYNTGFGQRFNASTPATTAATLLNGTGFSSGTVDSSGRTLTRPHEADNQWTSLIEDAEPFGFHVRANVLGNQASPTRTVDFGAFGADSGIVFGQGGYPLKDVSVHKTRAKVNRVIPVGVGDGYPMITLKAATRGKNLIPDPNFETSVASWSAGNATLSRIVGGVYNRYCMQVNATGTVAGAQAGYDIPITGTSTGRKIRVQFRVASSTGTLGKTGRLRLTSFGGVGSETATATVTLTAAYQVLDVELTLGAARTAVIVALVTDLYGGQAVNDKTLWSRGAGWESYDAATATNPYCVESLISYYGGVETWFIADPALEISAGVLEEYLSYKGDFPIVASFAGWQATCDTMYMTACQYLTLNKVTLSTYTASPIGLKLVNSSGTQLVKPGDKHRLRYRGVDSGGVYLEVDQLLWEMGWRRKYNKDGSDDWTLQLSTIDARYMDDLARLAKLLTAWQGSQTELKQSNYHTTFTGPGTYVFPGNGYYFVIPIPTANILAIQSAKITVGQTFGAAVTVAVFVERYNGDTAFSTPVSTFNPATRTVVDLTTKFQQDPTPVPWPEYASGLTNHKIGPLVHVQQQTGGAAALQLDTIVEIEATKIPLIPT